MVLCFCSEDSDSDSYGKEEPAVVNQIEPVKELKTIGEKKINVSKNGDKKGK